MIKKIRVEMFRGLTVLADGQPVLLPSAKINKPWQVFSYLVANRSAPTAPAALIDALWAREELSDPANVLKNTIYALRKAFPACPPKENPILFEQGGYICNPFIRFEVDTEQFEADLEKAAARQGTEKIALLKKASAAYKGDFLPQLGNESWVVSRAIYLKKLYNECMATLTEMLYAEERYGEVLEEATIASRIDPLEEVYYLYTFRALLALNMYSIIVPVYKKTATIFSEQLGVPLLPEIVEIYNAASEKLEKSEQDILYIKQELEELDSWNSTAKGPLYCTYDVFKYLYQMMSRMATRNRKVVILLLLSLRWRSDEQPQPEDISGAMAHIKHKIMKGLLRKSDGMARYSQTQFIFMLAAHTPDDVQVIQQRLHTSLDAWLAKFGLEMVFSTTQPGSAAD